MFSKFFIERPVFASVMSIVIVLIGLLTMRGLPVAEYPEIVPPQVTVSTMYAGASAETIADTVAAPLEQELNGIENMLYINSVASSAGTVSVSLTFKVGTNINEAMMDVNNKVQAAINRLPQEVQRVGVQVNKRSPSILKVIALYSGDESRDTVFVANYGLINVVDELKRIPGVGEVQQFGSKDYSMRIWLDPNRMAKYGVTPNDVSVAIRDQNSQFAAGQIGQEPLYNEQDFTYTVITEGRLNSAEQFGNIVLRANQDGSMLKIKDIARVDLGSERYNFDATFNGKPTVPIGLFLQTDANALEVSRLVDEKMAQLAERFPQGIDYAVPYDTSKFVKVSIEQVIYTFVEALVLVSFIVFLFLQNARATLIPLIAIPVSIIGTFISFQLLGFSINQLTLFGMILAIGIVVDDAIIVVENVERIMRQDKLKPKQATIKAMKELTSPLIAIVLVLSAVFIPVAFIGGFSGEMYKQFAITIVVSVAISGLVALTLTPALCASLLKDEEHKPHPWFGWFNRSFEWLTNKFSAGVAKVMRYSLLSLLLFVVLGALAIQQLQSLPKSLVPQEDKGSILVVSYLPPAASLSRTEAVRDQINEQLMAHPAVEYATLFAGFDIQTFSLKTDSAAGFVGLKPWNERKSDDMKIDAVVGQLFGQFMGQDEAFSMPIAMPTITGMSMTGGVEGYIQNRVGASTLELSELMDKIVGAANARPELQSVRTTLSTKTPQYEAILDREKALAMQVSINEAFAAMQSTFGSLYVNDFNLYGRTFRVNLQSESEYRETADNLKDVFVRSATGEMVSLANLIDFKRITGADVVDRFNLFPAAKITAEPKPGYTSGDAMQALQQVVNEHAPQGFTLGWVGSAYQEELSAGAGTQAFLFGLLIVFLILAAQYERWTLPLAVVMAVPFAVLGAALATKIAGLDNDIYFELGLLTLIGLSAKNAILIVEFAMQKRAQGMSLLDASQEAARMRFRPIVMTSLAFTMAAIPLMLSEGAGAAARNAVGTGVVGGMILATFLAPLFIPMFFRWIATFSEWLDQRKHRSGETS
ncbi:MAG: multidrug efflux RND transporter permease subunit [Thiomicrospira sp.]|uniref:efflux RND transporter permease subunit n=1 Tax=Thiomicrospira sp. TaxID=935 RepID=UPI0019EA2845|nr:multidrug efflux RND transporter permease subunit [Thiomicrospira sp.]MBE0494310.1 multidrug efflux RND transporter permease subunit [Thiomicrospira sp.]